ncbi:ParB N-terminal domain-containing protein [Almyronema epifaneia]|uniref:ParB N-terminal domain-containing protein n=1 Tax=Almyronema epifaneia S1 TaxID=2991925 RepID=A0ABW6IKK9_9CYAN
MAEFAKVDIKEISSDVPRSNFDEAEIAHLSDAILESGGIIRPVVLKQVDIDQYKVLDGHLEYYAAVRAQEKDPRKAEMVNAFVVTTKNEKTIQKQIDALRKVDDITSEKSISKPIASNQENDNSGWITSFETRLSQLREELFQVNRDNERRLKKIEDNLEPQADLLDLLNSLSQEKLEIKLAQYGVSNYRNLSSSIYEARLKKEKKAFLDYKDVVSSVKGLGAQRMLSIIDGWSRINRT